MKFSTENKIRVGYGAAFFLLLIAFSYSVFTTDQLLYHIRWVGKTNRILHNLEGLLLEVKDLDASIQNMRPGDTSDYTDIYRQHFSAIDSVCNLIVADIHEEYIPRERLQKIQQNLDQVQAITSEVINYKGNDKTYAQYLHKAEGFMAGVESTIMDMHTAEKALLTLRSRKLNDSSGSMEGINVAILVLALLLAGYSWRIYSIENNAKKKANARTSKSASELEKKVRELTDANKELVQLRSLQKFISTGRIARMIAHEVRNPLTNINLSCEQLTDITQGHEHTRILLDTIMRNSNRINLLVSELLNATKLQELKSRNVSINKLLDETLEIARDRILLEHIQVVKNYTPDICDVTVDAEKIKIAFLNIILNAIEAMDAEGGLLEIKTESRNGKCVIQIADNGSGMDEDSMEKIFDPYYTNKPKGNGLGLTNTQNIILNHKGTIAVESEVGIGTVFTITLDFTKKNRLNEARIYTRR